MGMWLRSKPELRPAPNGMWNRGTMYDAGIYHERNPAPFPPITEQQVMTPYWMTVKESPLQEVKDEALDVAFRTNNGTMEDYLNRRNNLAAALHSGGDPRSIQKDERNQPHPRLLTYALFCDDNELVALLLVRGADVHERAFAGYAIEIAHTVDIANLLIAYGALNNERVRPLHNAVCDGRDPALVQLYRSYNQSPLAYDLFCATPLMQLAWTASAQPLEVVQQKAKFLCDGLTPDEMIALIAMKAYHHTVCTILEDEHEPIYLVSKIKGPESKNWLRDFLEEQLHVAQLLVMEYA